MWQTILFALACGFAVCEATLPAFAVPTAGNADYVLRTKAGYVPQPLPNGTYPQSELDKEGSQRYAYISQGNGEWDSLGSSYTIEFWVRPDAPPSSPITGANTNAPNEYPFQVILTRHPGNGRPNEDVQFHFQITRTNVGMAVVFWSGCGCLNESRPETCGFGYVLNSDNRNLATSAKRYLFPNKWTHLAVTVDGDDLSTGLQTKQGNLYMDGQLVFTNTWADPGNGNRYKLAGLCKGGGMRVTGDGNFDLVTLGKHSNQDATYARPSLEYGFNGLVDEIRFWKGVRTAAQISYYWSSALLNAANIPSPYPSLVAYFRFNEPVTTGDLNWPNFYSLLNVSTYGVIVTKDPVLFPVGDNFVDPTNETISTIVVAQGKNIKLNVTVAGVQYSTPIFLTGSNGANNSLSFQITSFSPALAAVLQSGQVTLTPFGSSTPINPAVPSTIPQFFVATTGPALFISLYCTDATCGAIGGQPQNFYFEYTAFNGTVVGTTARIMFDFRSDCETVVDACGVCGGDNRDCQCVWYRDFRNARMAYVLFEWSRKQILGQIDCATNALNQTLAVVTAPGWDFNGAVGETIIAKLNFMMNFYDGCLGVYCSAVSDFVTVVQAYLLAAGLPVTSP